MDTVSILKFKHIDINKINLTDFDIKYENSIFMIQTPIFDKFEIANYGDKKYLELKFDEDKSSHIKFLTLIDAIELKINKFINGSGNNSKNNTKNINADDLNNSFVKKIKTQIITNIQNKKSLKVKITDETSYFNSNREFVNDLYSNNISLLLKIEFYNYYYSWVATQILQLD